MNITEADRRATEKIADLVNKRNSEEFHIPAPSAFAIIEEIIAEEMHSERVAAADVAKKKRIQDKAYQDVVTHERELLEKVESLNSLVQKMKEALQYCHNYAKPTGIIRDEVTGPVLMELQERL